MVYVCVCVFFFVRAVPDGVCVLFFFCAVGGGFVYSDFERGSLFFLGPVRIRNSDPTIICSVCPSQKMAKKDKTKMRTST